MSNKTFDSRPFEKLKKKIASKQAVPPQPPLQKKKEQFTDEGSGPSKGLRSRGPSSSGFPDTFEKTLLPS